MPKVVSHTVSWVPTQSFYVISQPESLDLTLISAEDEQWSNWLMKRHSFAFQGQHGHLTLRKEARTRKESYWYAYRSQNQQTVKRYAGRTNDLSIARLEEIADEITKT